MNLCVKSQDFRREQKKLKPGILEVVTPKFALLSVGQILDVKKVIHCKKKYSKSASVKEWTEAYGLKKHLVPC